MGTTMDTSIQPSPPPLHSYWLFVVNKQLVVSWQEDPIPTTSLISYQLSTYILSKLLPWSISSLVPVSYQQLTRFLPGEKQYLILAITLYRLGTCISSMPPPSALVNTHHSYESIILSSYSLANCFLFHISSIFLICMIPVFHAIHYPDPS